MILVLGGARSGKSTFAQQLALKLGDRVCFIATASACDEEMERRIEIHRGSRPEGWDTIELEAKSGAPVLPKEVDVAILDCFTVYLYSLMASSRLDWTADDEELMAEEEVLERCGTVEAEAMRMIEALNESIPRLVVVSNEVGMGLVPAFRLGRIFRDIAGRLNQRLAAEADEVFMVIAGLPVRLKPWGVDG